MNVIPVCVFAAVLLAVNVVSAAVTLLRTPDNGIQPQAALDEKGRAHLIYFKGDPKAGDIFYVREREDGSFGPATQVNRQTSSAIAVGTIRGAQLALGRNGKVHVVWNGSSKAGKGDHPGAPMLYAQLNESGTAFEPERDLITFAAGLDGGGSVAADGEGNVYVTWHAQLPDGEKSEAGRAVFLARSTDDGRTFARERHISPNGTGACGCCGMRAFAGPGGSIYLLYRATMEKVNRDEILLVSRDRGASFNVLESDRWVTASCPMSSATITACGSGILAAWETAAQVHCAVIDPSRSVVRRRLKPTSPAKKKHPVAVGNDRGEILLVWTEGTGWQKGGAVAWQVFDETGQPVGEPARADGVPVWSLATAYAKRNGEFVIVY